MEETPQKKKTPGKMYLLRALICGYFGWSILERAQVPPIGDMIAEPLAYPVPLLGYFLCAMAGRYLAKWAGSE